MKAKSRIWIWLLVLAAAGLSPLTGCDMHSDDEETEQQCPYPEGFLQKDWPKTESLTARTVPRPYRIREGDKLEIIYFVKTIKDEEDIYALKIRDVISVRFPFNKDLNQDEAEVQSDGEIQLPLIGPVNVFAKTLAQIQKELEGKYSNYLKSPVLTVSLKQSKREIDDLREAITTSPRGQSRLVPVTPDGTIALPLIGSVMAAGYTVEEVREVTHAKYRALRLKELEVTVNLEFISPLRVYVMGEVQKPGLVFNTLGGARQITKMSLLQALGQAGSYNPKRAEISKVLLVRSSGVPSPQVAVINVRRLLENPVRKVGEMKIFVPDSAKFRHDIWLEDGDVIYVPTKTIASRADYIEYVWTRGIYAVIPVSYSIQGTYNAVDAVDWLGPPR